MSAVYADFRTRIGWIDTDASGVHHHTAIARYVEAAEAQLMAALGLDDYFPRARRVHYEVDLEAPLVFGDEISSVVAVERVGTSSLTLAFEVWRLGDERVRAARGSYVTVHVRDGHSSPWPAPWLPLLGAH